MNLFIITTALITLLCVLGLFNSLKSKNMLGAGFSFISLAIFGWFTVMSIIEAFTKTTAAH